MHIDPQQLTRDLLINNFESIRSKNKSYSLRSFAKKLDISNASLSDIINGNRKVSEKKALSFAKKLNWTAEQIDKLQYCFKLDNKLFTLGKYTDKKRKTTEVFTDESTSKLILDWRFFSIVGVLRLFNHPITEIEIAELLDLSPTKVKEAITILESKNVISRNFEGKIVDLNKTFASENTLEKKFFIPRIEQNLQGMQQALNNNKNEWESVFHTVSTSMERVIESQPIIDDFSRRLCIFLSQTDKKDQIFDLSINIFARSKKRVTAKI